MNKFFIAAFLIVSGFSTAISQTTNLSEFSYVIVPDQFDFLDGKDKYELNSMAKFYLEKHGFNAYLNSETPNANRCDGLYANVEKLPSVLRKKLQVTLKDCNGFVVYTSVEGTSKIKEFKSSYQDALRKAFVSFKSLRVDQKDVELLSNETAATTVPTTIKTPVSENSNTKEIKNAPAENSKVATLPSAKFSNYLFNGKSFLLRKTAEGYSLYEETTTTGDGLLLLGNIEGASSEKLYFVTTSEALYKVSFDALGNLIIQKENTSEVYKKIN
ncbi:hypothetical protein [Ulvibacter litoralis]|uniref:Uncharacterized protein n=1 Tax=Ulvibacter litoralis TaxID=227084 RepID=A0A1G7BZ29_9FLAO|nr:hypothetical protein [Ulvibacter litoralis]GHC49225.1 hypothetical protein GCM10008083_10890 [Ulvibacter litoralis]SDE32364.1 hypothetical protein SAMN05421855_10197 [Ulvibacter litoralis]